MSSKRSSSKRNNSVSSSDNMNDYQDLSLIFIIVINCVLYYYVSLLEKEKCVCSNVWQRDYIKYLTLTLIVLAILSQFIPDKETRSLFQMLSFVVSLVNIYSMFTYGQYLAKTNCECAIKDHSNLYNFMVLYNYIQIAFLLIGLFYLILFSLMMFRMMK
jgi:hypothetical protein